MQIRLTIPVHHLTYIEKIFKIQKKTIFCKEEELSKKTLISLNLSEVELDLLKMLCEKKDMNKTAVIRQALRMMSVIEQRIEQGEKFYFETSNKEKSEVVLL
jgi:hypothetical protein